MTARPQQMPDGQDKSDDLIAELAKLMASNAGASEADAESRPAPRLVTLPEADKPQQLQQPAPAVRIPGMDAPAAAPVASGPASPLPTPPAAQPQPISPGVLRIPGMDQPVAARPAEPAPTSPVPPSAAVSPVAPEPRPTASVNFGTLPPASTSFKSEPLANWQDREIPRPVAARPAPVDTPAPPAPSQPTAPAVEAEASPVTEAPAAEARRTEPAVTAPAPAESATGAPKPASPAVADPMVAAAKASPAGDSFDFDFGFSSEPPAPIAASDTRPQPRPAAPAAPVAPVATSADPIADLIAAELDAAEPSEPEKQIPPVLPARPAAPAPAPTARSFPTPSAAPQPRSPVQSPLRSSTSSPAGSGPAPVRAEDRFGVAPVFGPGGKAVSARPQPPIERDPMDEIESLIGEAVRVELTNEKPASSTQQNPAPQPAPVVPPLTTGFAPRRAVIKDTEPQVPSAEAAILAAAAATGAEVGRLDSVAAEPSPYKRPKAKPERRNFAAAGLRPYVGMAVAGTLLLAAGFGLYWVLGMGRGTDVDAPVLQADATPVKETPPPAPTTSNDQGSIVFGELDGTETPPADEQLVSRDDSAETSVADVATPVGDEADADVAGSESELANRKVRTVTVRPDGTIVSGDEAVAGNETLPVDRPVVPDLPGADVQPSELLAAVPGSTAPATSNTDPIAAAIAEPDATEVAALPADSGPAPTIDPSIVAPVPIARPADRTVLGGGANQPAAPAASAAAVDLGVAPAASAPVSTGGGAYVQLSSQPSEADAQASLRATQNRLSGILGGRSLAIRQVDLGAKGTWYRVVLPVDSFSTATQTCASLKANGVDCVPIGG